MDLFVLGGFLLSVIDCKKLQQITSLPHKVTENIHV